MLRQRIITALISAFFVVSAVFFFKPIWFLAILSLFILVGVWEWIEFCKIGNKLRYSFYLFNLIFILILFVVAVFLKLKEPSEALEIFLLISRLIDYFQYSILPYYLFPTIVFFWLVVAPVQIILYQNRQKNLIPKSSTLSVLIGIFLLWSMWSIIAMFFLKDSYEYNLILLFLIVWSADIAAYFSGKKYGKHILVSRISPAKTWEGVVGGLVAGILITLLVVFFFREAQSFLNINNSFVLLHLTSKELILLSSITVIFSIVGDLYVSTMKREAGKKDSGILFPGHGGVLDRIDGLMAASITYYALIWMLYN